MTITAGCVTPDVAILDPERKVFVLAEDVKAHVYYFDEDNKLRRANTRVTLKQGHFVLPPPPATQPIRGPVGYANQ